MSTRVSDIAGIAITLGDGTVFELTVREIAEYEIKVGDFACVTVSRENSARPECVTIHQFNRHKADITLVLQKNRLVGRVTRGTRKQDPDDLANTFRTAEFLTASSRG